LKHLELHKGPRSRISWLAISRGLLSLQTLVLREPRPAPRKEPCKYAADARRQGQCARGQG
jgi:hypothetical protein